MSRGVQIESSTRLLVTCDDEPEGEGARLAILRFDDYYLSVVPPGQLHSFVGIRFRCSGERSSARTAAVALLDAVCRGDIDRVRSLAWSVVRLAEMECGR